MTRERYNMMISNNLSIEQLFSNRLESETGEHPAEVTVVRKWSRPYSDIYLIQYKLGHSTQFIVAKRIVDHDSNRFLKDRGNESRIEFDTLKFIKDKLDKVPHVDVPNPRWIDQESNCYFMDFINGEELELMMNNLRFYAPRSSLLQLTQVFFYAGRWLKNFQKLTTVEYMHADALHSIVDHCEHRLKLIHEYQDPRCPRLLPQIVGRQIDSLLSQIHRPVPVSGCHGDFGPWNMLVSGDDLTIIDFFAFRREVMHLDATSLLITLENQNAAISYSERRVKILSDAFMNGYSTAVNNIEIDRAALELIELLQRVCSVHGALMTSSQTFRARLRSNRIIKKNLRWIGSRYRTLVWDRYLKPTMPGGVELICPVR